MILLLSKNTYIAREVYNNGLRIHLMRKYGKSVDILMMSQGLSLVNTNFDHEKSTDLPIYQFKPWSDWYPQKVKEKDNGYVYKKISLGKNWIKEVKEIYVIKDPNPRSFTIFHEFYKTFFQDKVNSYNTFHLHSLDGNSIKESINNIRSIENLKKEQDWLKKGEISFYVDFCFERQLIKFNPLIQQLNQDNIIEVANNIPYMSKYMVQCLYAIRKKFKKNNQANLSLGKLLKLMHDYGIGSCTSSIRIIENCVNLNLLTMDQQNKYYQLTLIGEEFLSLINPECEEENLEKIIHSWMELPWNEAKATIDNYMTKIKLV